MRILVATAVPVERDAVARAFAGPVPDVDVLAVGVGPALAAAYRTRRSATVSTGFCITMQHYIGV